MKTFIDAQSPMFGFTAINDDVKQSSLKPNYQEIHSSPGQTPAKTENKHAAFMANHLFSSNTKSQKLNSSISVFSKGCFNCFT